MQVRNDVANIRLGPSQSSEFYTGVYPCGGQRQHVEYYDCVRGKFAFWLRLKRVGYVIVLIDECSLLPTTKTGGLLSDVFLHLIPHAFMGESQAPGVHFLIVEEKRNILIG